MNKKYKKLNIIEKAIESANKDLYSAQNLLTNALSPSSLESLTKFSKTIRERIDPMLEGLKPHLKQIAEFQELRKKIIESISPAISLKTNSDGNYTLLMQPEKSIGVSLHTESKKRVFSEDGLMRVLKILVESEFNKTIKEHNKYKKFPYKLQRPLNGII